MSYSFGNKLLFILSVIVFLYTLYSLFEMQFSAFGFSVKLNENPVLFYFLVGSLLTASGFTLLIKILKFANSNTQRVET